MLYKHPFFALNSYFKIIFSIGNVLFILYKQNQVEHTYDYFNVQYNILTLKVSVPYRIMMELLHSLQALN
jgi:hypothetical protein